MILIVGFNYLPLASKLLIYVVEPKIIIHGFQLFNTNDLIFHRVMATFVLLHKSFSPEHQCISLTLKID